MLLATNIEESTNTKKRVVAHISERVFQCGSLENFGDEAVSELIDKINSSWYGWNAYQTKKNGLNFHTQKIVDAYEIVKSQKYFGNQSIFSVVEEGR